MLEPKGPSYNLTTLSIEELEARLTANRDFINIPRVLDAYEMARSVHEFQVRNDGTPYFYHSTRTAKILLDEVGVVDADVLIAALLHDVLEDSDTITKNILEYNFGSYVAYCVDVLTKNLEDAKQDPDGTDVKHAALLKTASDDCLLIKLSARLDNVRCLGFNLKRNPLVYLQNTLERYVPMAESRGNHNLRYLAKAIRLEANKYLG